MCLFNLPFIIMGLSCVADGQATKIIPCHVKDIACVTALTQQAARGYPEYKIPPADPVTIPELLIQDNDTVVLLRNINVAGLRNLEVNDFKVLKMVGILSVTVPVQIYADITLILRDADQDYSGIYKTKANVSATSVYGVKIQTRDDGKQYLIIGDQNTVADVNNTSEVDLKLNKHVYKDSDVIAEETKEQINKLIIRRVVECAFGFVIGNIRSIAKKLPKNAFFIDL